MPTYIKNFSLERLVNLSFCMLPISLILGNLIVHLNLYIFLILCIFFIKKKNYKFSFGYANSILICFFLSIIITSSINHFSAEWINSEGRRNAWDTNLDMITHGYFVNSILLLRFLFLYLVIETLLKNNKLQLKEFFATCFLCALFISVDIIIQYLFGRNLLGFRNTWNMEITGVFLRESIAGSYLQKFGLISIFSIFFFFNKKNNKKILFAVTLLILIAVFFASNRANMIMLFFSLILLLFLAKNIRLTIFCSLITFLFISTILISNDEILKNKYHHLYYRFIKSYDIEQKENLNKINSENKIISKKIRLADSDHFRIYFTAIESWKNNPILGWGHKSFRLNCRDILNDVSKENERKYKPVCSSHPHNYHIEVLHNTGVVGFFLISFFALIQLFKIFKILANNKSYKKMYLVYFIPIIITLLAEAWPIRSAGSLFATWNGTTVWLIVALSSIVNANLKEKSYEKPLENKKYFIYKISTIFWLSLILKRLFFI